MEMNMQILRTWEAGNSIAMCMKGGRQPCSRNYFHENVYGKRMKKISSGHRSKQLLIFC